VEQQLQLNEMDNMNMKMISPFMLTLLFLVTACNQPNFQGDWIGGSEVEKLKTTEKHFRGLDVAMVEIGHRYQELYWAGQDENWEYATYQLDKIRLSLTHAMERRPLRKESGDYFLMNDLPLMNQAISKRDTAEFNDAFQILTTSCNSCHAKENVSSFNVTIPKIRTSIISR
jgi:hypothetical protein